jgi:hypothetical protein
MTGTPSVVQSATLYTITSTNSGGLETTTISIAVSEVVPVISYGGTPFTYTVGVPLSLSSPTNTGGTITGCSVSPALPGGLSLSGACVLSGTPAVISPLTTYTVTATSTAGSGTTTIQITVNSPAPDISYSASPYTYTKGTAIATLTPANSGGAIVSCAISPTQPTGLSFNTATCVLSGTPTASSTAKNYTITATNTGGSSAAIINITVNNAAPTISYSPATYTFTKGTAITTVSATLGGGAVSSCSASPALPVGLAISNTTCAITGTPTATAATASYTITVSSTGGSANAVLSLTVNDAPPVISYTGSPFTYTTGAAISLASPTSSGGAITGCTSNPALPSGLSLSGACVISGTPSVVSSQASYTITASSTGGAGTTAINITVNSPPPNIAYSGSPFVYPVNSLISTLTPANSGGAIVSCSISPALPAGLALSATTCAVSGTPTIVSATTNYTITATNTGGTSSAVVSIQVTSTAPSLTYSTTSYTFTEGTAISTITPTLGGGATTSCTSSPTLPSGLALSNTTCVITGTPTALAATSSYTITASNTGGSATAILSLTVNDKLPVILYSGSPYTFTKNTAITSQTPTNTGGAVLSCSVSPSLPGGLALSSLCVLSGTPTAPTSATVYSVTATNSAGSSSTSITITVQDIAPTLSFAGSPFTYTIGTLVSLTPTTGGGTITNCVSSPALPAGLSLSTSTCAITGNPTNTAVAANYVITALNSGGSAAATINMTVKDIVPAISYAGSPLTLYQNTAMSALTPTSTGGAIVSCTATNLPAGLTISASDCTISGTPTTVAAVVAVTVSAVNTGGTGTASISIKVDSQPPSISYPNSPYTFVKGTVITAVSPANAGGVITGCSVSPAMPAGLSLSTTTCVITGTPSVVSATTTYTVTATNNAGTFVSSAPITLLVIANSPNITYTSTYQNQVFVQGTAITAFSPTNSGGAITSCVISPTLPAGLAINATTCAISGTPTAVAAQNSYTITATNTAGSSNATISLTVNDVPPNITYAGNITANSYGFKPGTTIPTETPTNAGGTIVSCSSNPALPSGLILSTLCVITGNPTTTQTAKNYLISATNSGGTSSITVSMTINSTYPQVQAGRSLASAVSSAFEFTSVNASSSLAAATFSLWSVSAESGDFTKTLVNPDYTALPPLTEPGPYAPRISSDGKRVVYASKLNADGTVSGSYNVWIMNFDGSGKQQLTFNNDPMLDSMAPSFSADGSVIYFSSKMGLSGGWNDHPSESYNVWIMSVDGTQLSPITENALPGLDSQPL